MDKTLLTIFWGCFFGFIPVWLWALYFSSFARGLRRAAMTLVLCVLVVVYIWLLLDMARHPELVGRLWTEWRP